MCVCLVCICVVCVCLYLHVCCMYIYHVCVCICMCAYVYGICVLIVECVYRCMHICFLCCRLNWQVGINRGDSLLHHYTLQLKIFNQYCWYLQIRNLRAMAVIWTLKELVDKSVPCVLIVPRVSFYPSLPCSNKQRVKVLSPPWGYFRPSPFTHWLCMLNIPSNHCATLSVQGLLISIINYYIVLENLWAAT